MVFEATISAANFERWVRRLATLSFLFTIQLAAMALLFQDSVFLTGYGIAWLIVGLMLRRASRRLRTDPQFSFALIERTFYLGAASSAVAFLYTCWTNPEVFSSLIGMALVLIALGLSIIGFIFILKLIDSVRSVVLLPRNASQE